MQNYPLNIFKKTLREDILIKEILKDHVIFLGLEEFINIINNSIL